MNTEKQQSKNGFSQSEDLYRIFFNSIDDSCCIIKVIFNEENQLIDCRFLEVNRAFEEKTGLRNPQGQSIIKSLPECEDYWYEIYGHVALTGESRRFENREKKSNRWYEVYAFRIGKPEQRQVAIIFEDITKRKEAEVKLQQTKDKLQKQLTKRTATLSKTIAELCELERRWKKQVLHYQQALNFTNTGSWEFEIATEKVFWSEKVEEIWGMELGTFRGEFEQVKAAIHPDDFDAWQQSVQDCIKKGKEHNLEYRILHNNGSVHWVQAIGNVEYDAQGKAICLRGLVMDITARKKIEERLRIFERIVSTTQDLMAFVKIDYTYGIVNDAYAKMFRKKAENIIGQSLASILGHKFFRDVSQPRLNRCFKGEEIQYQEWFQFSDDSKRYLDVRYSPYRKTDNSIIGAVVTIRDITQLQQSQEHLNYLAHHDPLTNLPNRLLLKARLDQSIQQATRKKSKLAVVFIDLDQFKHINDSMGHTAGDDLLQQLAQRLSQTVHKNDNDMVARLGGDEFVMILEDIENIEQAGIAISKLMEVFREPFLLKRESIYMTASMGLSLFPDDGTQTDILLRNADTAMYRAKEEGRNTYCFYVKEMTSQAFEYMLLENALRKALKNNEFYLVYQPQINLSSYRWIGIEVLLRWHHTELGIISPTQFIPIAEQSGLIHEIGSWVLNQACHQGKIWLDQGLDFGHIAVNIAASQFKHNQFISTVEKALQTSGLPSQYLEFELTESVIMEKVGETIQQLKILQQLGIQISIDDFGTGYSSLSYLKQLPIDKLKIDRSFIQNVLDDPDDLAICEAIIALGKALNLKIIAEGVETEAQAAFLQEKGCNLIQGYFYSHPLSLEALEFSCPPC